MGNREQVVLVTGASGFIGKKICQNLSQDFKIVAFDKKYQHDNSVANIQEIGDIQDSNLLVDICKKYSPDIVIHCAGIAHQQINSKTSLEEYDAINHRAVISLAINASKVNPNIHFIFLSSISVYGEGYTKYPVIEENPCNPTTPYAKSKLDAERNLNKLYENKVLKRLDLLRLAPVFDLKWSLNLEKRVLAPSRLCYIRYGSGNQKMSALSLNNLVYFVKHLTQNAKLSFFCNTYNVTDEMPYTFNQIIKALNTSKNLPKRLSIRIPLGFVWFGTRFLSVLFPSRAKWYRACYDKLAYDLVFDNKKMLTTDFKPKSNLQSVFVGQ